MMNQNATLTALKANQRAGLDDLKTKRHAIKEVIRRVQDSKQNPEYPQDVQDEQPPTVVFVQMPHPDAGQKDFPNGESGYESVEQPLITPNKPNFIRAVLGDKYIQEQRKGKSTPLSRFSQALRRV